MIAPRRELSPGEIILSINPGHDGAVVALQDGVLCLSYQGDNDSRPRHALASSYLLLDATKQLDRAPRLIATSGWSRHGSSYGHTDAPYYGIDDNLVRIRPSMIFGQETLLFESTHERSHIFCSYGMSPFNQGEPCYVLIWEGQIGSFYYIDESMHIHQHGPVLSFPGYKYSFLYDLADPSCAGSTWRLDTAGKLMALAGYARRTASTSGERGVIQRILRDVNPQINGKVLFKDSPFLNCGVTNSDFRELVASFSDALFEVFHEYARARLKGGHPLLIAGGCGLNCEWNSKWRKTKLFREVFVPPVADDSGTAIGTAIEAQYFLSRSAKISWSVYSGPEFVWDGGIDGFCECALDYECIANLLAQDQVIAWVQGKCEIGPRALGNRSLLASPFKLDVKDRLNKIKQRERYRPIAPVCLEGDANTLFGVDGKSEFMLYFYKVRASAPLLSAITHVDGTARVQTVSMAQNISLYKLLAAFKRRTGFGVLCNTSLNRKGRGFINRSTDLFAFARERNIDAVVVGTRAFLQIRSNHTDESKNIMC